MTTLQLNPQTGQAIFTGLTPSNIGLSNISQDANGDIHLGASASVDGILSAYGLIEARESYTFARFRPWSEPGKFSLRLEVEGDNNTSELDFSVFRGANNSNEKAGISVYRTDGSDLVNAFIGGTGSSYVCAYNGWFGVGTDLPYDRLHVANGYFRCSWGIKIGDNFNVITYASAPPVTGTHSIGDILFNSAPIAGGFIGWVCVAAGTPGTWKTWGAISA